MKIQLPELQRAVNTSYCSGVLSKQRKSSSEQLSRESTEEIFPIIRKSDRAGKGRERLGENVRVRQRV